MPRASWHPYLPQDFLCCLSLQAGVVGCSVIGLTLMLITTLVNIYGPNTEEGGVQVVQYFLLFLYLIVMYIGFMLSFMAAFWEISKFLKLAAYIIGFGLILYIVYMIVSAIPHYPTMINVCPGGRCPDHHWLHEDHWRSIVIPADPEHPSQAWSTFKPHQKPKIVPVNFVPSNAPLTIEIEYLDESFIERKAKRDQSPEVKDLLSQKLEYKEENLNGSRFYDDRRRLSVLQQTDNPHHQRHSRIDAQPAFIVVSVVNVLCFIAYLLYSLIMFLALARQLDKRRARDDYD